ncbi:MAG: branched-chain amino acid ABC transporter permease [Nitrospinota bacterium]|nr:MAG: branched-chain amino acid ABC transporter permease [Nitrospinota bacterium]
MGWWRWGGLLVPLAVIPPFLSDYPLYLLSWALVFLIASIGLNLTLGYAGQVSLAHAAFFGIGAYTTAILTNQGWSFWLALPLGGLLACAFGFVLGFPALRVQDHYLAMVTLGFNIVVFVLLRNWSGLTGGVNGINPPRPTLGPLDLSGDLAFYYVILVVAFAAILLADWVVRSKWGRAFRAMRENELAAAVHGVNLRNYKVLAFALGALYAGIGGGLFGALLGYIDPEAFHLTRTLEFLIVVVVGGLGRFAGPFLGTLVVTLLPEVLRPFGNLYLVVYAGLVLVMMLFLRKGLVVLLDGLVSIAYRLGKACGQILHHGASGD